jgi:uncharacterized protein (DUF2252 family)
MEPNIEREILDRLVRLETKLDDYNGLRGKLDDTHTMVVNHDDDIKEMKDSQRWLWRAVVGAIIGSAIAYFIKWR